MDTNQDQRLSQQELLKTAEKKERPRLIRDFKVFDGDHDQQLTFQEYQNIVHPSQRKLPHPLADRIKHGLQKLQADWSKWDANNDGKLDKVEFSTSNVIGTVSGLALSKWEDWDRNADGIVDPQDAEQVLEIAYGLRYPTGELLWEPSGRMLTTMLFDHLDLNGDHQIDLQEAKQAKFGFRDGKQTPVLFNEWDQDGNGKLSITEWKIDTSHWRDPVGLFLASDKNQDGLLTQEELVTGAESWTKEVSKYLLDGFDADGDQRLSLDEYRQTPFSNLALQWHSMRTDRDHDGYLSISEFQWGKGVFAAALATEYFQRLDLNQDGKLDLKEFPFSTTKRDSQYYLVEFQKLDADENQQVTLVEFLGEKKDKQRQEARRSFYDWDSNADGLLSLAEFSKREKQKQTIPKNEFRFRDEDNNQSLTLPEFLSSVPPKEQPQFIRDFKLFDLDNDQRLTFEEYLNTVSPDMRKLSHPVVDRVAQRMLKLQAGWSKWDTNNDGKLDKVEFSTSNVIGTVSGLALSKWEDWDRNADGFVDPQEAEQVLEIAYGLRYPTGELLWEPGGRMLTSMLFDYLDQNRNQSIDLAEAKQAKFGFGNGKQTLALFKLWDNDGNENLSIGEWKTDPSHWRDPVGIFLVADKNYDGYLSQEELVASAEPWMKEVTAYLLPGFDLDDDQRLSLDEYRQTPFSNLSRQWHSLRTDQNQDGVLTLAEFRWGDGLLAAALTVEYFEQLDLNQDGKLDLKEFPFNTTKRDPQYFAMKFKELDTDQNQFLSIAEYLGKKEGASRRQAKREFYDWDSNADEQLSLTEFTERRKPKQIILENEFRILDDNSDQILTPEEFLFSVPAERLSELTRNFKIFDENQDQRLTFAEYLNLVSPSQRKLSHPFVERVAERLQKLKPEWSKWDTNSDGKLNKTEFSGSGLARSVPGLALTVWEDWDRNTDGFVDLEDAEQVLEIAYGLRYTTGELLWEPSGRMLTTMLFDHLDLDDDHQIDWEEAKIAKFGFHDGKQTSTLFKLWDQNGYGKLTIDEWKTDASHWRDPVGIFLAADTDRDGLLSQEEHVAAAESWTKDVSEHLLGAFDLDSDQHLSLDEFRQTPFSNLAREWHSLRSDRNQDGALNLSEFSWGDGLLAATLTVEYFERLDLNQDQKLDQDEFNFNAAPSKANLGTMFAQLDLDQDGSLSFEEYSGNLKLPPNANEKQVIYYETRLARLEDAFRKADININKKLDQLEFQSEPSLEAIAPNLVQKKKNMSSLTVGKTDGSEAAGGNTEIWVVLTLNGLLLIGAIVFILRKTKRSTH
ncbi:EF-hand domain-containing protein [Gimesia sp.]|uniref:EF-hand domain-containing protein n=2 Tax=Gimesia TaxID=1649453 RepID=UPI0025B87229|nr:EF-hand domain-containing protein [Gimesia sp.]